MADIDIVPKRRSNLWLWIVLALVIVAVLWFAMGRGDRAPGVGALDSGTPALASAASGPASGPA